jgi:hypothetical protein
MRRRVVFEILLFAIAFLAGFGTRYSTETLLSSPLSSPLPLFLASPIPLPIRAPAVEEPSPRDNDTSREKFAQSIERQRPF